MKPESKIPPDIQAAGNLSGVCFHASVYSLACSWRLPVGNTPPSLSQSLCIWIVPSCRKNRETTHHSRFSPPTPSISSSAGDLITGYPLDIRYRNLFDNNQVLALFVSIGIVCLSKEWEFFQFLYTVDSTRAIRDSLFWILGTFLLISRVSLNFSSYKNLVFGVRVSPSEDSKKPCWNCLLFEMNKNKKCDCCHLSYHFILKSIAFQLIREYVHLTSVYLM